MKLVILVAIIRLCNVSNNLRNDNNGRKSGTNQQKPQFGLRWKMFELDGCEVGSYLPNLFQELCLLKFNVYFMITIDLKMFGSHYVPAY